ncbi:MAG: VOC family protein [Rhodothermales bacterium]|nr:VOC family protein [Rhodothermales bacterium]
MKPSAGQILWVDLTVEDAGTVRDFYQAVVGFETSPVDMDGYSDFSMLPQGSTDPVAGVCHARGSNADIPPAWLVYFTVEDVAASAARCEELGGQLVVPPRGLAGGRFCVVKDPAGAVCALYQPPGED